MHNAVITNPERHVIENFSIGKQVCTQNNINSSLSQNLHTGKQHSGWFFLKALYTTEMRTLIIDLLQNGTIVPHTHTCKQRSLHKFNNNFILMGTLPVTVKSNL